MMVRWLLATSHDGAAFAGDDQPSLLASVSTANKPVQFYVNGRSIHVSEVRGSEWALCAMGIRCGFGRQVEVFKLDRTARTLEAAGSYQGELSTLPFGQVLGSRLYLPTLTGYQTHRAQVQP